MKDSIQKETSKHSFILMLFTLLSRLLGIVKARVITTAFGATIIADVINTAYYLPNNLRKLFAEGAMNTAFIPFLAKTDDKNERSKLLSLMLSFQLILFALLIFVFILFGTQIFDFISDFGEEGTDLGGKIFPYFIGFLALISLSNVLASLLQVDKKFLVYGIAPLFFSIILIFSVYIFSDRLGAQSMAYGVVLGSLTQFIFTLIFVIKLNYRIKFSLLFNDREFNKVLKVWAQVIISNLAILASQQFSAYLSTTLATGSATAFSNSMIFFSTPYGIIFTGIATVSFPQLSEHFSKGNIKEFKSSLSYAIDGMLYMFIPATIILMTLSRESIAVVLQNGKFTYADTLLTSSVLFHFLFGLTIIGINGLMIRAAIAQNKVKLSLKVIIIQSIIDVAFSVGLIKAGVGIKSLAIANNIAASISLVVYFIILRDSIEFKHLLKTLNKTIIVNLPLTLLLIIYYKTNPVWFINGSNLKNFSIFALIGFICASITLFMYFITKIPILNFITRKKK
ncbi:MAG: murein biosynthesis integral membrane protein MurJ [Spirochaetaceae bacterium]|nr:murein biosynthesis integral membrane protein MurJ [Spirochaetaceae bacterium]